MAPIPSEPYLATLLPQGHDRYDYQLSNNEVHQVCKFIFEHTIKQASKRVAALNYINYQCLLQVPASQHKVHKSISVEAIFNTGVLVRRTRKEEGKHGRQSAFQLAPHKLLLLRFVQLYELLPSDEEKVAAQQLIPAQAFAIGSNLLRLRRLQDPQYVNAITVTDLDTGTMHNQCKWADSRSTKPL